MRRHERQFKRKSSYLEVFHSLASFLPQTVTKITGEIRQIKYRKPCQHYELKNELYTRAILDFVLRFGVHFLRVLTMLISFQESIFVFSRKEILKALVTLIYVKQTYYFQRQIPSNRSSLVRAKFSLFKKIITQGHFQRLKISPSPLQKLRLYSIMIAANSSHVYMFLPSSIPYGHILQYVMLFQDITILKRSFHIFDGYAIQKPTFYVSIHFITLEATSHQILIKIARIMIHRR